MQTLKKNEDKKTMSPFGRFCIDTKGHEFFTSKGTQVDKWEVWCMGVRDTKALLSNNTRIISNYTGI